MFVYAEPHHPNALTHTHAPYIHRYSHTTKQSDKVVCGGVRVATLCVRVGFCLIIVTHRIHTFTHTHAHNKHTRTHTHKLARTSIQQQVYANARTVALFFPSLVVRRCHTDRITSEPGERLAWIMSHGHGRAMDGHGGQAQTHAGGGIVLLENALISKSSN